MSSRNVCFILTNPSSSSTQQHNIDACTTLSNMIRSCLGPHSHIKMIISKMNSILTTNDTNSILRELDVSHPALKILFDLAKSQSLVGDGTTTVILLTTEILINMKSLLNIHASKLIKALYIAKRAIDTKLQNVSTDVENVLKLVEECVETKMCKIIGVPIASMAVNAINVANNVRNVKIIKIVGNVNECEVISGVYFNKNIMHPQMRRRIENGKIMFLDNVEFNKAQSQMTYEFANEDDFNRAMHMEESAVISMVDNIVNANVDLVVAEHGISDLALALLHQHNITCLRRFTKTEFKRLKQVTNAINEIGTFTLFECEHKNNDYYCKILNDSSIATVILKGPSREVLDELESNFDDAVKTAYNLTICKKIVPGGGAIEMVMANELSKLKYENEVERQVFNAVGKAMRIVPTVLLKNFGANVLEMMAVLENLHEKEHFYGVNGKNGKIVDMRDVCMDHVAVKRQAYRAAIETVCMLLKIDGIVETK